MNKYPYKVKSGICYLYFIFDGKFFKIGNTKNPKKRISDLQVGCSDKNFYIGALVRLPNKDYAETLERELHSLLINVQGVHIQGEWFDLFDDEDRLLLACFYYCTKRVIGDLHLNYIEVFDENYNEENRILDLVGIAFRPE